MDKAEREALAVDIARRVRLITTQSVPDELIDMLMDGQTQIIPLYTSHPRDAVHLEVVVRAGALHVEFVANGGWSVAKLRFDRASSVEASAGR